MTRDINPFGLRMPAALRARLEDSARDSGRSLNAEIVWRLEQTYEMEAEVEATEARYAASLQDLTSEFEAYKKGQNELRQLVEGLVKKTVRGKK